MKDLEEAMGPACMLFGRNEQGMECNCRYFPCLEQIAVVLFSIKLHPSVFPHLCVKERDRTTELLERYLSFI
jgi:hypothetical protein